MSPRVAGAVLGSPVTTPLGVAGATKAGVNKMFPKFRLGRLSMLVGALLLIVGAPALVAAPGGSGTGSGLLPGGGVSVRNSAESLAPVRPSGLALVPASPSNNRRPTLKGDPGSGDFVRVYKTGDCSGTNFQEYPAAQLANGVEKRARIGTVTTFSARGRIGSNLSLCSDPISYVEDETPPVVTLTAPAAGSATGDATPTFAGNGGTTPRDLPAIRVDVFRGASAAGSPQQVLHASLDVATGAYAVDASPALPDGTYTARATQADAAGNSAQSGTQTFRVVTGHPVPSIGIFSPADGAVFVQGATAKAAFACADPGGPGVANCAGPVANAAPVDTADVGPHSFSVTAVDDAGAESTKTSHYRVLSPGTITLTGPAHTFHKKGKLWLDTGFVAACPELGPDCTGSVTAHRAPKVSSAGLSSQRFGYSHVLIRGAKAGRLTILLGSSRAKELNRRGHIRLRFDARLSRGTSALATAKRTVNLGR
jgi:hypothetical protein